MEFESSDEQAETPFETTTGAPSHLYTVGSYIARVEEVCYAASIDGAPLEVMPECADDAELMPGMYMAIVLHCRNGDTHAFYRRGVTDGFIRFADHVPTDDELGLDEWTAFWEQGGHSVQVRRDSVVMPMPRD